MKSSHTTVYLLVFVYSVTYVLCQGGNRTEHEKNTGRNATTANPPLLAAFSPTAAYLTTNLTKMVTTAAVAAVTTLSPTTHVANESYDYEAPQAPEVEVEGNSNVTTTPAASTKAPTTLPPAPVPTHHDPLLAGPSTALHQPAFTALLSTIVHGTTVFYDTTLPTTVPNMASTALTRLTTTTTTPPTLTRAGLPIFRSRRRHFAPMRRARPWRKRFRTTTLPPSYLSTDYYYYYYYY